jgi:CheY-like chemotaxis protein
MLCIVLRKTTNLVVFLCVAQSVLPLMRMRVRGSMLDPATTNTASHQQRTTVPLRILIADDDHHVRAALRAFLSTMLQCEIVAETTNGAELLVQTARHHPDSVVLDLRMPELDGIRAIRILKSRWPEIRVVVLTLYGEQRTVALAAGADAFVAKGDAPEQLIQALCPLPKRPDCDADAQE